MSTALKETAPEEEMSPTMLQQFQSLELNHFDKASKSKEKDGEFVVSTCQECKPSEIFPLPSEEESLLMSEEDREQYEFCVSLMKDFMNHIHKPMEMKKKNVGCDEEDEEDFWETTSLGTEIDSEEYEEYLSQFSGYTRPEHDSADDL